MDELSCRRVIRLSKDLDHALATIAAARGWGISATIRHLIGRGLDQYQEEERGLRKGARRPQA